MQSREARCCTKYPCFKEDASAGFFKLLTATDLIYILFFFIILLSQACQLVFVPQRGIKLLISPSLGELSCYPMKLKTVLSDRDFRSSD